MQIFEHVSKINNRYVSSVATTELARTAAISSRCAVVLPFGIQCRAVCTRWLPSPPGYRNLFSRLLIG